MSVWMARECENVIFGTWPVRRFADLAGSAAKDALGVGGDEHRPALMCIVCSESGLPFCDTIVHTVSVSVSVSSLKFKHSAAAALLCSLSLEDGEGKLCIQK